MHFASIAAHHRPPSQRHAIRLFCFLLTIHQEKHMSQYQNDIQAIAGLKEKEGKAWHAINPESAARMRAQNRFKTGLDIARYTAQIMRDDMANYDADPSKYTQSLGCWHGFIGQQKMISIK